MVADLDVDAERFGALLHDAEHLRVAVLVDEERVRLVLAVQAVAHRHRLGGGGRLVEQRAVGDLQAGQLQHEGLVVQQRLHAALRDLGLVGRVLRVPARVLQDVALDHRRRQRAVVAHADVAAQDLVLGGERREFGQRLPFGAGRRGLQLALPADRGGDRLLAQVVEVAAAERLQHGLQFLGARTDVTAFERVVAGEGRGGADHEGDAMGGGRRDLRGDGYRHAAGPVEGWKTGEPGRARRRPGGCVQAAGAVRCRW